MHSVNHRRAKGADLLHAVIEAAVSRCRPIMLTSLTTFARLTPLMLNQSVQAQFLVPMATSLSYGVMFSTLVTLFVVPSAYLVLQDIGRLVGGGAQGDSDEEIAAEPGSAGR